MPTTRLIDHRHSRTYRAARFFGNEGEEPSLYAAPLVIFVPYALLSQFWWFLSWQAMVLACTSYLVVFLLYCAVTWRGRLVSEWHHGARSSSDLARLLWRVQRLQRIYFLLPSELRPTLEDSLQYCYRALELEQHTAIEPRVKAAEELLEAHQSAKRVVLEGSDDLERVHSVTKALKETSSTKAVQAA